MQGEQGDDAAFSIRREGSSNARLYKHTATPTQQSIKQQCRGNKTENFHVKLSFSNATPVQRESRGRNVTIDCDTLQCECRHFLFFTVPLPLPLPPTFQEDWVL